MKTYSVYLAPAIKAEKGIIADGAKHWERLGTIESKNKETALAWLKKNKVLGKEFVYVLMQKMSESFDCNVSVAGDPQNRACIVSMAFRNPSPALRKIIEEENRFRQEELEKNNVKNNKQ